MGRPPVGKQAMSGAERQRRYLARLLRDAKPATTPFDTGAQELAQTRKELAEAKARIADLEKQKAHAAPQRPKPKQPRSEDEALTKAKKRIRELQHRLGEIQYAQQRKAVVMSDKLKRFLKASVAPAKKYELLEELAKEFNSIKIIPPADE
jgi:hypothetical protein